MQTLKKHMVIHESNNKNEEVVEDLPEPNKEKYYLTCILQE